MFPLISQILCFVPSYRNLYIHSVSLSPLLVRVETMSDSDQIDHGGVLYLVTPVSRGRGANDRVGRFRADVQVGDFEFRRVVGLAEYRTRNKNNQTCVRKCPLFLFSRFSISNLIKGYRPVPNPSEAWCWSRYGPAGPAPRRMRRNREQCSRMST